jgi:hypothetical protein
MKKHLILLFILALIPTLAGCGEKVLVEKTDVIQEEPNEIIQLSDDVIMKEYDNFKIVSIDGREFEVKLSSKKAAKRSGQKDALIIALVSITPILTAALFKDKLLGIL